MFDTNLEQLDQEQALDLCKFYIQAGKNCFLFGRRGTGKTEIAFQVFAFHLPILYKIHLI